MRHRSAVRLPFGVAAGAVLHADRMALRVHQQALLARERALHRPLQQPRRQRGLRLVAHVLLAAERAAVRHELDDHLVAFDAEHRRDLVAVVPHALAARPHVQRAVGLRARRASTPVRGTRARCAASGTSRARRAPTRRARRRRRRRAYVERDSTLPSSSHTASSGSSIAATGSVIGRSTSYSTSTSAAARRAVSRSTATTIASTSPRYDVLPPSGMNTGQSVWMMPTRSSPGTSAAVNTASTPGSAARGRRVDAHDSRPRVVGEAQRAVQHPRHPHVVDVVAVAERELAALRTACRGVPTPPGSVGTAAARRVRAAPSRRGSSRSRCSGRGARRGGAPRRPVRGRRPSCRRAPSSASTMPGVQNPHCRRRSRRSSARTGRVPPRRHLRAS